MTCQQGLASLTAHSALAPEMEWNGQAQLDIPTMSLGKHTACLECHGQESLIPWNGINLSRDSWPFVSTPGMAHCHVVWSTADCVQGGTVQFVNCRQLMCSCCMIPCGHCPISKQLLLIDDVSLHSRFSVQLEFCNLSDLLLFRHLQIWSQVALAGAAFK